MFYRASLQAAAALASLSLVAGCSVFSGSGSDVDQHIAVGSTSSPSTLDPAGAWDNSWELMRNVFQTLVSFPTGSTAPEPDAAECTFTDSTSMAYRCELRPGLTFSNGDKLDAEAVKYSIDRIVTIKAKGGPLGLLGSLDRVETKGDDLVIFHLKKSDATFPFVLATPAMSIVSPHDYPKDKLRTGNSVTGSGPYVLDHYEPHAVAELQKNDSYKGFADRKNESVTIRYFDKSDAMVAALRADKIDATYRGLTADEVVGLQNGKGDNKGLQLVESVGADIRFLVFNPKDPVAGKQAVREAIARLVDRDALVAKVYQGTAEPLYSIVPKGIAAHTTSFFDTFGDPDVAKARGALQDAGITTPVAMTFWYTTDRYGSSTGPEFEEIKRQLEKSGLFRITLRSAPWTTFQEGFNKGDYPVFGRGWFPDFPDPDNFVAPFVGKESATGGMYVNKKITDQILPASRQESDRGAVSKQFAEAQQILVEDIPLLPLWQGKLYIAAGEDIGGGERALDPQTVMQMWELYRKASW
ncbi:ABC transporter substrate-binding protein [Streptomyces sp. AM 2-1-1]|uniref:ABC transporter substrate-binding protein n=1 Tax=unclassified Streptomyces TaxID=2593676 RepID=UPI0023B9E1C6|nr:ABC transporter substrate-binding protein [Streptomyces sp. AM 2-1-1]WEH42990.1 ABC transporter substrate-binding protein [Streptomyces sp. AM 2-1-1]